MNSKIISLIISSLSLLLVANNVAAENKELRKTLDHMFERVDFNSVPTGLLRDYAVEEEDLDLFTGRASLVPENRVSGMQFMGLISTVNSLGKDRNVLKGIDDVLASYNSEENEIPFCVLLYKYSQIKANALQNSLITYKNGQVTVSDNGDSPYQQDYVFACCGLKRRLKNRNVIFSFPAKLNYSNCNIEEIKIDFGNETKILHLGEKINVTLNLGTNDIRIHSILSNGVKLSSHTTLYVENENIPTSRSVTFPFWGTYTEPDSEIPITGDSYRGIVTSATISIRYGQKNGIKHTKITKPFIFVEGFDPRCLNPESNGGWNDSILYSYPKIKDLLYDGFDVVYVDWDKSEEYIQANANVLIKVLKYINNEKKLAGSSEKNIILGHSMGGLVIRYALKTMENNNQKHEVSSYISYDSPHLGAHIPLGILYGYHGIKKFINEYGLLTKLVELFADIDIPDLLTLGDKIAYSTAAQQMLVYYVDPTDVLNNDEHRVWQQELNNLGFPKGDAGSSFNMLSVAHGSYNSVERPEHYLYTSFKAQSDILNLSALGPSFIGLCLNNVVAGLLTCLPGRTTIQGEVGLYPGYKNNDRITHLNLKYKKKFLWLIPINKDLFTYDRTFPGGPAYDSYPSSVYPIVNGQQQNAPGKPGGIKVLFWWDFDCDPARSIPFVPTSSALAIGNGININPNEYLTRPTQGASPFGENIFILDSPASHTTLNENALVRIIKSFTTTLTGPVVGVSGSKYELSQNNEIISWSTSDPSVASIDSNGVLGKGIISVIARAGNYSYSKNIMVGMPRFVLSGKQAPGGFNIEAKCIDSEYQEKLDMLNGAIKYKWGIKYPGKDILWNDFDESNIIIPIDVAKNNASVFFQITDMNNTSSTIQSISCNIDDIYCVNNDLFYLDTNGKMFKANKSEVLYEGATISLSYINNIDESFKSRDWMVTSAKVGGTISSPHIVPISRNRILVRDIVTEDELSYMKTASTDGDSYSYILILRNSDKESIQILPIIFTFKTKI